MLLGVAVPVSASLAGALPERGSLERRVGPATQATLVTLVRVPTPNR
ncbi:hypothetical protein [Streptomyces vinaceus]|nr:hypothetical protein [Streptomyces vinaceus]GHE51342.1 hypothetical protein GCM10017778_39420 [Streptomyces vinaceus]